MKIRSLLVLLAVFGLAHLAPAVPSLAPALPAAEAQSTDELRRQAEQILGRPVTDQEIMQRLRDSGMSPEEIRRQLESRGYDPSAADPYLNAMEGGGAGELPPGTDPVPLTDVLDDQYGRMGELGPQGEMRSGADAERRDGTSSRAMAPPDSGPPVYGRELFRRATSQLMPITTGPAPPDYRLGPGDQVVLVLTGGVEAAYRLTVNREGWVVIPDVGRILVSGKTLSEAEETFLERLSQAYSGITGGADATTHFDLALGQLRTSQVYVIGEVERPASYEVSGMATTLSALYRAGGPTRNGSFRNIEVKRGGETVRTIDLYDYLSRGDASRDLRLEHGDIVFVPVAERQVRVSGPVTRPGIYEVNEEEGLRDLLRYAGGVEPDAELRRVQIRRILAPERRTRGRDRTVLDVPLGDLADASAPPIELRDGDRISIFAVLEDTRNEVEVSGGVWRPGIYGADGETRLWDVIERAGGLLPDVYQGRAQIQRLGEDYTRQLIPVTLERDASGEPVENPVIEGMDQIYIYAKRGLREDRAVSVGGWVRDPGVYPYVEGMTVADLVLQAGGLRTGVYLAEAEVARVVISQTSTDTLTRWYQVPLDSSFVFDGSLDRDPAYAGNADASDEEGAGAGLTSTSASERPDGDASAPGSSSAGRTAGDEEGVTASDFTLRNLDAVYVRKAPGFEPQKRVTVAGEVQFSGPYSLLTRTERLTDLVERAGGLTSEAYPQGFQLWRTEPEDTDSDTMTAAQIVGEAVGDTARSRGGDRRGDRGDASRRDGSADDSASGDARRELERDENGRARRPGDLSSQRRERVAGGSSDAGAVRTRVGVDFVQALRNPDGPQNILVEPGDSIFIPRHTPTVDVRGAVAVQTKVLHKEGEGLDYYIRQAGGYREDADEDRVRIRFANGEVATKGGSFLFFGGGIAEPDPGSTITVPATPPSEAGEGFRVTEFVGILTSVMTAGASIIIAVSR